MIRLVIWIVVGLLALSFFGVSLRALVENPTNQDNLSFLSDMVEMGWDYIVAWFTSIWEAATWWS
ncbi:MAG TPA: hypothetical protein VEB18_03930 [Candidatus Paceibacterota bacterium]|nr:hypothetical protein [Candidatus Paceibacterota bacterium]